MCSEVAIHVANLGKCFHIYDRPHHRLLQMIKRGRAQYFREFWALRDVSFDIRRGETVGIIGRNGSGKSTLLQMICGTLNPTIGTVRTHGRVAALLELGSGFNPEFSGRENVYMNAALLGMSTEETTARFADIAAFADIGDFIEQPVKTYSSGMMIRLAFAVAINADPEILVVDEALSVGDELFQRKCFSRIEAIRASGATILFVSHSGAQIVELCDRAILLDNGEMLASGPPKQIVGRYQKLLYAPTEMREAAREKARHLDETLPAKNTETEIENTVNLQESYDPHLVSRSTLSYETHGAHISEPVILTLAGERVNNLIRGKVYRYCYSVNFSAAASNVLFGMMIKTISGVELGGGASAPSPRHALSFVERESTYNVEFQFRCALNPGVYFLNAGVMGTVAQEETFLHRLIDVAIFRVLPDTGNCATGIVDFDCRPDIEQLHDR